MAEKARITSDFPSTKEVASRLKIPSDRLAELLKQLDAIHIGHDVRSGEFKKATGGAKNGNHRKSQKAIRTPAPVKKR